ncbi:MAG TPA: extracellular solute-binding protein [Candidatus Limnocylindria bacterium]|nr:extracellular solute-binding protein [Candidatus Limnocylindria bacterium]
MSHRILRSMLPLGVILTLVLAACGGGGTSPSAGESTAESTAPSASTAESQAPASQDATAACQDVDSLTFTHTMNDQESPVIKEIAEGFTGTTVEVTQIPFEGAQQAYDQQAAGGEAPDVFRAEIAWIADYADKGYLVDLTDLIPQAEWDDFLPGPLAYGQWQGGTYALPQVTDALALLYNKSMFDEASVEVPTTMDEFVTAGQTLQEQLGLDNAFYMRGDAYWLQPFLWAFGGGLFDVNDQGQVTDILVNNEGSVAGLEFLLNEVLGVIAPADVDFANDYGNAMTAFKEGDVAMIFNGPWATTDILSGTEFSDSENLGIAVIPAGPDGDKGSPIGGHSYVMYAGMDEAKQECAAAFMLYLDSAENQARLASELNLLPTRTSAYELEDVASNPLIADFQTVIENATARPVVPEGGQIYTDFGPHFQAAWTGDETPQEALDAVASAWETLLSSRMAQ